MHPEGLVTIRSSAGPSQTMDKIEAAIRQKGMTVFARIDHAAGAKEYGLPLRATEVMIFGNAKAGTPLMQSMQTIGLGPDTNKAVLAMKEMLVAVTTAAAAMR